MSDTTMQSLRRLTYKYDTTGDQLMDITQRQAMGEKPDPNEFMKLLELRSTAQEAMQAQFKLYEQPLKTVLNESGR